jgi:predicted nucleic acid-binding protein
VRGVLDTSVFIADEQRRPLERERLPDEAAISVFTLAELELGVHMAPDETLRARRLQTLLSAHATYAALPVDDDVASAFAQLVASARRAGVRVRTQDAWIAATALAHAVSLFTQDADFDALPGVDVVRV